MLSLQPIVLGVDIVLTYATLGSLATVAGLSLSYCFFAIMVIYVAKINKFPNFMAQTYKDFLYLLSKVQKVYLCHSIKP